MSDASPTVFNGRYALQRQLARGGMADVFLAHDELLDRPIAVKVLFPEFASDPAFVERFRREAQAAANLNHPNIVGIYDWGQEDGTYFIVMEYIEGRSLAEILRSEGPIDPDRAVEITADVAAALSFAHRGGLVHRDVKPGNVLVTSSGQVKVADFGIATAANAGDANLTKTGLVMGTATYFAPEQAQGKPVDPRSDLYSLGVVLYEMLAGEPPFKGDNPVAIAYQHVQQPPPGLRARGVPVPEALEAITLKLLAKNPAHRYPGADDLRADLRRYRDGMHRLAQAKAAAANLPGAYSVAAAPATTAMAATGAVTNLDSGRAEPPRRGGSTVRTGAFAVLMVLVLIVLAAIFLLLLTDKGGNGGDQPTVGKVSVPSLIDKTQTDAETTLRGLGLVPTVVLEENLDIAAGKVFRQNPVGGNKVDAGTQVQLTVSKGKNTVSVPNVVGMQVAEAEQMLRAQYQLDVQLVADPKSTRPENEVIKQDPLSGTKLEIGKLVTLTYSLPAAVTVPDVANQTAATASANLTRVLLEVVPVDEASDTVEQGKAIRTDPVAGTQVKSKSKVTLFISSGLPKVIVPDVIGLAADSANRAITDAGLRTEVKFTDVALGSPSNGRVISQSPLAPTQVNKGTVVTITVGRAPATTTTSPPGTTTTNATATTTTRP